MRIRIPCEIKYKDYLLGVLILILLSLVFITDSDRTTIRNRLNTLVTEIKRSIYFTEYDTTEELYECNKDDLRSKLYLELSKANYEQQLEQKNCYNSPNIPRPFITNFSCITNVETPQIIRKYEATEDRPWQKTVINSKETSRILSIFNFEKSNENIQNISLGRELKCNKVEVFEEDSKIIEQMLSNRFDRCKDLSDSEMEQLVHSLPNVKEIEDQLSDDQVTLHISSMPSPGTIVIVSLRSEMDGFGHDIDHYLVDRCSGDIYCNKEGTYSECDAGL